MSNIIPLRPKRKAAARTAKRVQGDENAVKFGRTKAQKLREEADSKRAADLLDGHKRDV